MGPRGQAEIECYMKYFMILPNITFHPPLGVKYWVILATGDRTRALAGSSRCAWPRRAFGRAERGEKHLGGV